MIHFAQPYWIIVGIVLCIGLLLFFRIREKQRRARLARFAAHQLLGRLTRTVSLPKRRIKDILLLLGVLCCCLALARPQYGYKWVEVKRKGIDLLFALDTSKSMLAQDIRPNRLKRAHLAILDFVERLDGDRVGLMPFAGSSYLMCPLTLDYEAFSDSLSAINTNLIPKGGTNLAQVIEQAQAVLDNDANHKLLIILTDGENLQGDALKAAEAAKAKGMTIYTVGVGTSQGELIPLNAAGGSGFVKDAAGQFVTSRLDETTLKSIADTTGGLYVPLGTSGEGLQTIYQQKLALIPKDDLAERRNKVPLERFAWPLAAALVLFSLEQLVGERSNGTSGKNGGTGRIRGVGREVLQRLGRKSSEKNESNTATGKAGRTLAGLMILLSVTLFCNRAALASAGEEAFQRGDYLAASEYYTKQLEKNPDNPELNYNYGTAAYKNSLYDDAIASFNKALQSEDIELQKKAYYNRGNSYFRKGEESRQADPEATKTNWQQALESMDSVLALDPKDENADHNRQLIEQQIKQLEKEMQQQQQNNQQQKNDQNKQDQQQDQDQKQDKEQNQSQTCPNPQPGDGQQQSSGKDQDTAQNQQSDSKQEQNKAEQQKQAGAEQDDKSASASQAEQNARPDMDKPEDQPAQAAAAQQPKREGNDAAQPAAPVGSADTSKDEEPKDGPVAALNADQPPAAEKQEGQKAVQLMMSREEAEQLLNSIKNEEGELNFVPGRGNSDQVDQDW